MMYTLPNELCDVRPDPKASGLIEYWAISEVESWLQAQGTKYAIRAMSTDEGWVTRTHILVFIEDETTALHFKLTWL